MDLCNEDFPKTLQNSLESVIKNEGYVKHAVKVQRVGADGGSFLGELFRITIKGETKVGEKETAIFVKSIIPIGKLGSSLNLPQAYVAEAFVYNELSNIFRSLQEEVGIPARDRFKMITSFDVSDSKGIFLEDVAVKGYKSCHRTYTMSLEVAEMAITQIAKFHALSIVVKAKRPEYFKKKLETIDHAFIFGENFEQGVQNVTRIASRHLAAGSREKVEQFLPGLMSKWRKILLERSRTKSCLCHGDFRLNNLLMKHTDEGVDDLYVIDFQLIHVGSPINDLLYFIFTGTDQRFREKHLDQLKHFYYTTFKEFLTRFHLDAEEFYPAKEYESDFKERLEFGLIVALYFLPFFLADEGCIPDLAQECVSKMDFKVLDEFTRRIQGIVDDFISWGYL